MLESSVQLVELFLGLKDSFELLISFFLLSFVLTLKDLVLSLSINTVSLHNVVVVMCALKSRLHLGKLMLNTVQLHTSLFAGLSDLANFFLFLSELQVNTFVLVSELFGKSVLQTRHQRLNTKES